MPMTQLYRHFDSEGQLLYVGISISALERYKQHSGTEWFPSVSQITVEHFPTREEAAKAEVLAIKTEKPKFNIRHLNSKPKRIAKETPELIHLLQKAINKNGSQIAVAKILKVSPQRLNNWITVGRMPSGWEFDLEGRLGLNASNAAKRGRNGRA
jgi:hypothetical protein